MRSLTDTEATERAAAITVDSYDIDLDLTRGPENFGSHTEISFHSRDGSATFLDLQASEVSSITLNGRAVDVGLVEDGRLQLDDLTVDNTLVVDALMAYSRDGEGMHRTVDPEDKQAYLYAMAFLPAAPRIFACFDQPDLKAIYRLQVTAPTDWVVLGNGVATQTEPGRWTLAETLPLSTYFVTLVAGPYYSLTREHDGMTLGLHCRQSLARHLDKDADELFTITSQCFDEYHRLFGIRYPFGDYHQAFVPEFNAGAMENPGCVTWTDQFVFKAQATDSLRATRAMVVAHEMAHQWFGDLVTMTWWDDLWLNESFAEYMGYRTTANATRFDDVWSEYALKTKAWGLAADQRSSSHPIAGNGAVDAKQALSDFDGISYSKGAAVLRQLNAYLGEEAFIAGVVDHLTKHRFGNARLGDLLGSWDQASDKDVRAWAETWLRTKGVDTLSVEVVDGTDQVIIHRHNGSPEPVERPHAFTLTSYDSQGRATSVPVVLEADQVTVELADRDPDGLLLPDSGDETWAKIDLDAASVSRLPSLLPKLDDPVARAVVWGSLREGLFDGRIDPDLYLRTMEEALPDEDDLTVECVLGAGGRGGASGFLGRYLFGTDTERLAVLAARVMDTAAPGSNRQLIASRALIRTTRDVDLLTGWLAGDDTPPGLITDEEFRWRITHTLCALGAVGVDTIAAEQDRDPSSQGVEHALRCRAVLPDPEIKASVWQAITTDAELSNAHLDALTIDFFHPDQVELTAPYVERYFTDIPKTAAIRTGWIVQVTATLGFPRYAVDDETLRLAEARLADESLDSAVRRAMSDLTDELRRVLNSRRQFPR